jgi:hypothetical protein
MNPSFEQVLIEVWHQTLVENAKVVVLKTERYPVRLTPKRGLRQVDFTFGGNQIRGLEQNQATKSRWAQMARSGKKVMQFLEAGRYIANVADGKVAMYGLTRGKPHSTHSLDQDGSRIASLLVEGPFLGEDRAQVDTCNIHGNGMLSRNSFEFRGKLIDSSS